MFKRVSDANGTWTVREIEDLISFKMPPKHRLEKHIGIYAFMDVVESIFRYFDLFPPTRVVCSNDRSANERWAPDVVVPDGQILYQWHVDDDDDRFVRVIFHTDSRVRHFYLRIVDPPRSIDESIVAYSISDAAAWLVQARDRLAARGFERSGGFEGDDRVA